MQSPGACVVAFLVAALLPTGARAFRSAGASGASGGLTPVEKVVHLLKDLKLKIDADQKAEEKVYNKYACWCTDTTKRKSESIAAANEKMKELAQEILTEKATVAIAEGEIAKLTARIKENEELQAKLTAHRQDQNTNWQAESVFMKSVLVSLQEAVKVLDKATKGGAFIQDSESLGRSRAAVRAVVEAMPVPIEGRSFLRQKHLSLLGSFATGSSEYAPQSMTVQGILADMYSTFATDLEGATKAEATQNKVFEKTIDQLEKEQAKLEGKKAAQETKRDEAAQRLAAALQDYENTKAVRDDDTKFFGETTAACLAKKAEWDTREQLRAEELQGVKKAMSLLSSDDARELFGKAITVGKETGVDYSLDPTTFLQVSGGQQTETAVQAACRGAYLALSEGAREAHSLRLAFLAARAQRLQVSSGVDGFSEVLHQIDEMVAQLNQEQQMDIANRDDCIAQLDKNTEEKKQLVWEVGRLEQKIEKLEAHQAALEEEIAENELEKNKTIEERTELIAQRKADNEAWLQTKADDQAAVHLLGQVIEVLSMYYTNNSIEMGPTQGEVLGLVLIQEHRADPVFNISDDQAPEAVFSSNASRAGETKPILSALTMLRQDLEDEIRNDLKAEYASNEVFLQQNATLNALEAKLIQQISNLQGQRSETIEKIDRAGLEKTDTESERDQRIARISELKKNNCDFILSTFKERASKRAMEVNGLTGAKEYLATYMVNTKKLLISEKGWKEEQLLQTKQGGMSGDLLSLRFLDLAA